MGDGFFGHARMEIDLSVQYGLAPLDDPSFGDQIGVRRRPQERGRLVDRRHGNEFTGIGRNGKHHGRVGKGHDGLAAYRSPHPVKMIRRRHPENGEPLFHLVERYIQILDPRRGVDSPDIFPPTKI